jgi:hypothetical protein
MSFILMFLLACGGESAPTAPDGAPTPEAAPAPSKSKKSSKSKRSSKSKSSKDAPAKGSVFFVEPADGATVKSPLKVSFGVKGMTVKPAGTLEEGTGHHHLIVGPAGIEPGQAVPKDETHIHYGAGQTEAEVELAAGKHKLTMQFADGNHLSYGPALSTTITVTVE